MPRQPFEIGGGAIKLNDKETQDFFDAAEQSVIKILGINEKTMNACKDCLEEDGTYFRLQATVIRDGYVIIGSMISAELFIPDDEQNILEENEDKFEVEDEFLSFVGRFVELRFNNIDGEFHRVEGSARLVLDVMGNVDIEEGMPVVSINDIDDAEMEEETDNKEVLSKLLDADSRTPKIEDYMILNEVVLSLSKAS